MTSNNSPPDDFLELAGAYRQEIIEGNQDSTPSISLDELQRQIANLENDLEKYDEDHPLHTTLREEYEANSERLESLQAEYQFEDQLQSEFPARIISDFAATPELLTDDVLMSITHSLIGEPRKELFIGGYHIESDTSLDNDGVLNATKNIHQVVEHLNGGDSELQEIWESLSSRDKSILSVLYEADQPLGPTGIAENLDEDVTRGAVGPALGNDQDRNHRLTYKQDGDYRLTLVGEYLWKNFGSTTSESESSNNKSSDKSTDNNQPQSESGQLDEFTD